MALCQQDVEANGIQLRQLGRASRQPLLFWRRCGICRVRLTPEAANRSTAWLACRYHPGPGQQPAASSWEQLAHPLVAAAAAGSLFATESKMLGGKLGASDLVFAVAACSERRWVAVEVDGEGHTTKPWGNSSQRQRRLQDSEKDAAAWAARQPLVRLHYADSHQWQHALTAARLYVQQGCQALLLYTESYAIPSRLLPAGGQERQLNWAQVSNAPALGSVWHAASRCSRLSSRVQ